MYLVYEVKCAYTDIPDLLLLGIICCLPTVEHEDLALLDASVYLLRHRPILPNLLNITT